MWILLHAVKLVKCDRPHKLNKYNCSNWSLVSLCLLHEGQKQYIRIQDCCGGQWEPCCSPTVSHRNNGSTAVWMAQLGDQTVTSNNLDHIVYPPGFQSTQSFSQPNENDQSHIHQRSHCPMDLFEDTLPYLSRRSCNKKSDTISSHHVQWIFSRWHHDMKSYVFMLLFGIVTQSLETPRKHFQNFLSGSSFAVDSVDDRTPQHRVRPSQTQDLQWCSLTAFLIFLQQWRKILFCNVDELEDVGNWIVMISNFCLPHQSLEPNSWL